MPYFESASYAVRGALQMERQLDLVANNLANASTVGFKAERQVFNEMMERKVVTDYSQGPMNYTGNQLDLAIQGDGFFQVQAKDGMRLTRNGALTIKEDGTLVNGDGLPVLGDGSPITVNPQGGDITVTSSGDVIQGGNKVGQLSIVKVNDPSILEKAGGNLFKAKAGKQLATTPAEDSVVQQGFLEQSNIQVVDSMVQMINAYRSFEAYQKIIHTMQDMDTKSTTQVGRVG